MAEDTLFAVGDLLGWVRGSLGTVEEVSREPGACVLGFRALERPVYEQRLTGPAALKLLGGPAQVEPAVGESFEVEVGITSEGGEAVGVTVEIGGAAVSEGIARIDQVTFRSVRSGERTVSLVRRPDSGVLAAVLEDVVVPAGIPHREIMSMPSGREGFKHAARWLRAYAEAQFQVVLQGQALREGRASIRAKIIVNASLSSADYSVCVVPSPVP
jgi:hypothetical protein